MRRKRILFQKRPAAGGEARELLFCSGKVFYGKNILCLLSPDEIQKGSE